jgi:hypothetical protein
MKTKPRFFIQFISAIFVLSSTQVYAQVPAHLQADYSRMMRNQSLNNAAYRPAYFLNSKDVYIPKHTFTVLLKDSSEKIVTSTIHFDQSTKRYYLILENKKVRKSDPEREQKIYAHETINITVPVTVDRPEIKGVATDSCWLFKVLSGKINAYSEYAELSPINSTPIAAIQTGSGELEAFSPERLESLISTDGGAHNAFKKKHYYVAIKRYNRRNDDE